MPRQKRSSAVLEKADKRAAAIRAISEMLDLGGDLTLVNYTTKIEELRAQITEYNTILYAMCN
jgi:two-component sensor histidine kinase